MSKKMSMIEHLLMPFQVGNLKLKNRMIMAPMATGFASSSGEVTTKLIEYHRERAKGGVALNIVEFAAVSQNGRMFRNILGIFNNSFTDGLKRLASTIHEMKGKAAIQIGHGGRRVSLSLWGVRPIAPSALPAIGGEIPRELLEEDIKVLQNDFLEAALRAKSAGFDAIELNMCHGYLVHQFLSPLSNTREDSYGGGLKGRAKFAIEMLTLVKNALGKEFPIFCRISAEERVARGITVNESIEVAKLLEANGADAIHVSAGMLETAELVVPPMAFGRGCYSHYAKLIKDNVKVPVITVGRINTPEVAEEILGTGKADLIALGRALIADPEFPKKVEEKRIEEIRPCIGCNQGCVKRLYQNLDITCTVNPLVGIEKHYEITPVAKGKKVFVIGGGPTGLEFARVASLKGHQVTLFEKKAHLGGRLRTACKLPKREEISEYIHFAERMLRKQKVRICLGTDVKMEAVDQERPDILILATGGEPITPNIKGLTETSFEFAEDVIEKKRPLGTNIAIIGGGKVGCEVAELLALDGKKVTILEVLPGVATDMESRTKKLLMRRLDELNVNVITNASITAVQQNKIFYNMGKIPNQIDEIDTVVIAAGYSVKKADALKEYERYPNVFRIGDMVVPSDALDAIHSGFHLAINI